MITPLICAESDAQVVCLTGIRPTDMHRSGAAQTREVFEQMEEALRGQGMNFSHVVRTWFYLNDILGWYDQFNAERSAFFTERGVFRGVVPASTGVGMANEYGAALTGAVLAIKQRSQRLFIQAIPSPLQCPALDYRSSFSRAVEVQLPQRHHLYISGTASIDEHGHSVHVGDVDGQIRKTLDVVEAILSSRQMAWKDVRRAVAYFRDMRNAPRLTAQCRVRGITDLPVTSVAATICRDDLLFEMELDVVREQV